MIGEIDFQKCPKCGQDSMTIIYTGNQPPKTLTDMMYRAASAECSCGNELSGNDLLDYVEKTYEYWRVK